MSFRTSEGAQWSEAKDSGAAVSMRRGVLVIDDDGDWAVDTSRGAIAAGYVITDADGDLAADATATSGFALTKAGVTIHAY